MERPCQSCGACCFSTLPNYVRVSGDDHERLAGSADALTAFTDTLCFMRMTAGHCAALLIDVRSGTFACGVYETRPQVCRDLARGEPACAAELEQKSERAAHSLRVLC